MSRHEQRSIGELWITKGIRAGKRKLLAKVLKFYAVVPAAKVANRYFASAAMHNGAYAVANSGLPGDGLAHNVTCAQTAVDAEDTNGILTITGIDIEGKIITEDIIPNDGATVESTKAFKQVTSIVGSGWAAGGGADNIVIGFGDVIGLPDYIADAADILMVGFNTAIENAPTLTVSSTVLALNTVKLVGDASKVIRMVYQV